MGADYAELERLAREATPGPWRQGYREGKYVYTGVDDFLTGPIRTENAAYIAAASPDVILALLEERRALAALAASSPATAGRDLDEANWQPGYSEEFKRGFMTAIHEGLDPQTLAMAMDIAADTPIFDTGLTRADVVVREYERLRPATAGREE